MFIYTERKRPDPLSHYHREAGHPILAPLQWVEWSCRWLVYWLSGWAFLEVLEYVGTISVFFAVVSYFAESGDRIKQKHYQAWQVINTAQGRGGNGGRIDALQELNADRIPLVGVDLSGAFLQGIHLQSAHLSRSNLSAADLRDSDLTSADVSDANLRSANCRQCILRNVDLERADLTDSDLLSVDLTGADISGAILANTDLRNANLSSLKWRDSPNLKNANIFGVKNAPEGFIAYALKQGAVQIEADSQ